MGFVFQPSGLLSQEQLSAASDSDLAVTVAELVDEQKRRALELGDPEALAEEAFTSWGFTYDGKAALPRIVNGLLVCPGFKAEKSALSHDCCFVSTEGSWVWESSDVAWDEMRTLPGARVVRQTVTIVPAFEGMVFDVVSSKARTGPCRMQKAVAFVVEAGVLKETSRRVAVPSGHR